MKKSLIILLVLGVLLTLGLASCKNEVQAPADELVSVSFEQAVSRALTATLQEFKKENYYWYYAAKKADSTGLISGQTTTYTVADAVAVKKDGTKGLDGQVPGFSQGSWDFLLFAYEEDPEATGATITKADYTYWGEATAVVLKKNGANTVSVTVNPAEQGQGTLFVDMEHIKLSEASSASHNTVAPLVSISCGEKTYEIEAGSNIKYKVDAGQWIVKVEYTDGDIIFATGTVLATVYPRLTTIVTGDVSELITYAQFDAKENPDLVKVTAGSTATAYDAIPSAGVVLSGTDEGETKTVSTTVAKGDAQKIMAEMATNAGVGLDSNTKMSLALNVDPTAATETSITYDISMSATLSVTQGSETKSTVKDVDKLDNVVIVEISMQKDLQDVEVWHKTTKMTRVDSKDDLADGKFYYDAENGKLYICTSTFSPFSISYKFIEYAASLNGKKYETLAAAIAAASSEKAQTVYLLKDVSADRITISKSLVLDLCGFKVTSRITADSGNVDIKNGKIIGRVDAYDSSVLTIEADVAITGQVVVWGDGVFGAAGCKTPVLNFYGKATNTGDSALTTNGDDKSGAVINIYEGAEITSTDDIAVYLPSGNATFYGGTITGATAVYVKSGTLTIKDGDFIGNLTPKAEYVHDGNGASATGDAVVIEACDYPNGAPVVVINGGKFTGTKAAIGYYRYQESEEAKITVDGGKYNTDPSAFLPEGYTVELVDNMYVVIKKPASIIVEGEKVYYDSLQAAIDSAVDGQTVYLERDYDAKTRVTINGKSITLDGQNHSLSASQENISDGRTLNVWNRVNPSPEAPNVTLRNLAIVGPTSGYSRGLNIGDGAKLTIEGCTISAGHYAINVITKSDGTTIDLKGSSVASGWAALNIWSRTDITVEGGTLSGVNDKSFDLAGSNCFSTIVFNNGAATAAGSTISCKNVKIIADTTTTPNKNHQGLIDIRSTATDVTASFEGCTFKYTTNDTTFNYKGTEFTRNWMFAATQKTTAVMKNCSFYIDGSAVTVNALSSYLYLYDRPASLYNSTVKINGVDFLPPPLED